MTYTNYGCKLFEKILAIPTTRAEDLAVIEHQIRRNGTRAGVQKLLLSKGAVFSTSILHVLGITLNTKLVTPTEELITQLKTE